MRTRSYVISGVARNSLYDSFGEKPTPTIYFSYRDRPSSDGQIHLRTRAGTEATLAPLAQRIARELDPGVSVYDIRTLAEHVEKNLFLRRIPARMFVVLGPLLLVLAAIGIYAVVAHAVAHRTAEIGVRLALGARAERVVAQIVGESLRVSASACWRDGSWSSWSRSTPPHAARSTRPSCWACPRCCWSWPPPPAGFRPGAPRASTPWWP